MNMAKKKVQNRKIAAGAQGGAESSTIPGSISAQAGFSPDYSYVVKDLRRIGALAGSFIVILIVVSFFLR
jgi:hypothetical protein